MVAGEVESSCELVVTFFFFFFCLTLPNYRNKSGSAQRSPPSYQLLPPPLTATMTPLHCQKNTAMLSELLILYGLPVLGSPVWRTRRRCLKLRNADHVLKMLYRKYGARSLVKQTRAVFPIVASLASLCYSSPLINNPQKL